MIFDSSYCEEQALICYILSRRDIIASVWERSYRYYLVLLVTDYIITVWTLKAVFNSSLLTIISIIKNRNKVLLLFF